MAQRKPGPNTRRAENLRVSFADLESVGGDLSKLTVAFLNDEIGERTYRAAVYGANALVKTFHAAKITEIEKRLANLEKSSGRAR